MKHCELPTSIAGRQMNLLFDANRLDGLEALERSEVAAPWRGKRRQYDLVEVARQRGFMDVEVIDDDLGRSASGTVARPGFDRLVAWLCAGKIGAVLCLMPRGSRETAEIGTICLNCVDLSKPALLIWTVSITPVGQTTGFFSIMAPSIAVTPASGKVLFGSRLLLKSPDGL